MLTTLQTTGLPTVQAPVNRLSELFDRFFNDGMFPPMPSSTATCGVPLSMWEDEDNYFVELDAPGMTQHDIEVSIQHGDLIVRGERRCERQGKGYDTRSYGRFEQRISLPAAAQADKVDAKLVNGVLALTFPKGEAAKPKKIALRSGD